MSTRTLNKRRPERDLRIAKGNPSLPSSPTFANLTTRVCALGLPLTRSLARLAGFLKFDVNESSFSGSKVEFLAASFDLLVDTVKCLAERGGGLRSGVENIGKLRAKKPGVGAGEEQRDT